MFGQANSQFTRQARTNTKVSNKAKYQSKASKSKLGTGKFKIQNTTGKEREHKEYTKKYLGLMAHMEHDKLTDKEGNTQT